MAKSGVIKKVFKPIIGILTAGSTLALLLGYLSPFVSPIYLWWIQLFGLAYPVIIIIYLLLLIPVFLTHKRRVWVMLVIFMAGIPIHLRLLPLGSSDPGESKTDQLKITSFNVRGFDNYQWIFKDLASAETEFLNFITDNKADVLCLQEYSRDHRVTKHMSPNKIKAKGGFQALAEHLIVQTEKLDFGVSIYSKFPIINKGIIGDSDDLYAIFVDIVKNKDTLRIYNIHLQSIRLQQDEYSLFDDRAMSQKGIFSRVGGLLSKLKQAYPKRIEQSERIIEHAQACLYPLVICGDFNEPPTSYIYNLFNSRFTDAFSSSRTGIGRTYAGKIPAGRIDYIFSNESIRPLSSEVYREKQLSDHYPITALFELK